MDNEVQANKNYRQRVYGKVWNTVSNYYGMHEFNEKSMW